MADDLSKIEADIKRQIKATKGKLAKQRKNVTDAQFIEAPGLSLEPVFRYHEMRQREPLEVLRARFEREVGDVPPAGASWKWFVNVLSYAFQVRHYSATVGSVPTNVSRRYSRMRKAHSRVSDPRRRREGEAPFEDTYWDPDLRIVSARPNPYSRGKSWMAFQIIVEAGAPGVSYPDLVRKLEHVLRISTPKARMMAYEYFTRNVADGHFKLRFAEPAPAVDSEASDASEN